MQCWPVSDPVAATLCVIFMLLVSLENIKKCVLGGCTPLAPSEPLRSKKFQTTLILAFEPLSRENETEIVKITHSVLLLLLFLKQLA